MAARKGLGRGLSALLADDGLGPRVRPTIDGPPAAPPQTAPIDRLRPNPNQPRRRFDEEQLNDLAASIRQKGILQPILVRPDPEEPEGFEIVAGERRWRAAQLARLHLVPIIVKHLSDAETAEVAVIENVQRENLNPMEEAEGYALLVRDFAYTQEKLAEVVGKSRPNIANALRLLKLPEDVQKMLREGALSAGHGRALLSAPDPSALAQVAASKHLNVRAVEALVRKAQAQADEAPAAAREKDADTKALEAHLSAALHSRVRIDHRGEKGGRITIAYDSLERLDDICGRLIMD